MSNNNPSLPNLHLGHARPIAISASAAQRHGFFNFNPQNSHGGSSGGTSDMAVVTRPAWPSSTAAATAASLRASGVNGSPLHRAGYLSPKSYSSHSNTNTTTNDTDNNNSNSNSNSNSLPGPHPHPPHPAGAAGARGMITQSTEDIRAHTMELSLNPSLASSGRREYVFPITSGGNYEHDKDKDKERMESGPSTSDHIPTTLTNTTTTTTTTASDNQTSTEKITTDDDPTHTQSQSQRAQRPQRQHLSNLSILLARQQSRDSSSSSPLSPPSVSPPVFVGGGGGVESPTPTVEYPRINFMGSGTGMGMGSRGVYSDSIRSTPPPNRASVYDALLAPSPTPPPPPPPPPPPSSATPPSESDRERVPLLHYQHPSYTSPLHPPSPPPLLSQTSTQTITQQKPPPSPLLQRILEIKEIGSASLTPPVLWGVLKTAGWSIPAVLLGTLLNVLDGVSYGMIIFPAAGVFADLGGMGVSMFFVTTVIAQLTYTLGGSGFAGANGSMMIEVVPFFHIIASRIALEIGEEHPKEVIATTLVAFALSSVLTGLAFALLGALRLGALLGFFPRHILVGCIGGVGAFLIETGLTVSTRISDDDFTYTFATLKFFFEPSNLALWLPSLGLAVLLRVITHRYHHQLIFPLFFFVIPIIFYIVVAAARLDLGVLRQAGWLFDMGNSADRSWYEFYTYFDFGYVKMGPLWSTVPTQFALLFFNILHPPLNVPALAVSLIEDVDTNKELVAHGYSNLLAGIFGSVPNYLVYVNTLLFYRVGGGTRIAGFLLAVATMVLLLIGTGPIAYIPVMLVGSLIFVLGFDLVKEALWDTRHRVSRSEYLTIASIVVVMTAWDFVIGVLFGIVVSCFFFVVHNSQRRSIREIYTGQTAMSTVRRPGAHRAYIREVSRQTTIIRLHGFLFFGTITYVEEAIKNIVEDPSWQRRPVRFLVIDLTLVGGVDMSSAEAFVRVQRLLAAKNVVLVFCGFVPDSAIGKALQSVGVLGEDFVELFNTFNDAMEWTENAYLRAWFRSQKAASAAVALPGRQDADITFNHSLPGSQRRSHLHEVGLRTMHTDMSNYLAAGDSSEPYITLVRAFSAYGDVDHSRLQSLVPYLERSSVPEGLVLWRQGDNSDGLYLIESGVLRASYQFADHIPPVEESMVPGTLAGELSALTSLPRNATVVVERRAVLWKLSTANMRRLELDDPILARTFVQFVLKAAKIDYDILLSALATRP